MTEQPPYSMLVRGIEADVLPVAEKYGMGVHPVESAGRRLAERQVPQGPGRARQSNRSKRMPGRFDLSRRRTRPSWTPPTRWPGWPTRPGCR